MEEEYISRCKEDDQAVTWEEIVKAGEKDSEYTTVKKAIMECFLEKLEERIPLIQPYHKNKLNISVVTKNQLKVMVYHDSNLKLRILVSKALRNRVKQTTGVISPG